jgi:two-component system, NtrC family, response regulator AtoC
VAYWDGGGTSTGLPREGRCVVGRDRDADLVLEHASVSRRHAAIELRADGVVWEDLGSVNGTKVRGRKLGPGERVLVAWGEPVEVGFTMAVARGPIVVPQTAPVPGTAAIDHVDRWIELVAGTDMAVMLLGDTGVGKGFFARRIHERSARAKGPFVHINCAAIPENLLESELFGYERGAFTGALQAKVGLLESASGGTVFFDEVGEFPMAMQAKLLVAIERREVMRVGALTTRPFDARFVSATNRPVSGEGARGGFRQDLYYRLAGLPIAIPALRERRSEIPALSALFVRSAAEKLKRSEPAFAEDAIAALAAHDWPGNVRELATVIERAVLLAPGLITREHVAQAMQPAGISVAVASEPKMSASTAPAATPPGKHESERERITAALEACGGNQSRTAKFLGISRRTLINRIEAYGVPRPRK